MERPSNSPELRFSCGEREFVCNWQNTHIYTFGEPFKAMSHVYIKVGEQGTYFFNQQSLMDELHEMDFPTHHLPEPCDEDIEAWIQYQMFEFETELPGVLGE